MPQTYRCPVCSSKTDHLTSYFSKENGVRKTVCDDCANSMDFTDTKKYYSLDYTSAKITGNTIDTRAKK